MIGMDKNTGKTISGLAHLKQSIEDILTTPKGSRVMRRDYGSDLFSLVDQPYSSAMVGDLTMAVSEALSLWEPRFELESVAVARVDSGKIALDIHGKYLLNGETLTLDGIVI
ncbi:MAG: phage baseplate assembly protein W [Phenylobacterium sp.]|jgi:phage baseplate assembly protein W